MMPLCSQQVSYELGVRDIFLLGGAQPLAVDILDAIQVQVLQQLF